MEAKEKTEPTTQVFRLTSAAASWKLALFIPVPGGPSFLPPPLGESILPDAEGASWRTAADGRRRPSGIARHFATLFLKPVWKRLGATFIERDEKMS